MATIRKRGYRWQAQVRRLGQSTISRSFDTKKDAEVWSRSLETRLDHTPLNWNLQSLQHLTLADLLERYAQEVSPEKRGCDVELIRLNAIAHNPIGAIKLAKLTSQCFASYRDERLIVVKRDTVRRELSILRHCLEIARSEWNIPLSPNPVAQIRFPKPGLSRSRRMTKEEETLLLHAASKRVWYLCPIIVIAIETAMRRGEILSLKAHDIDWELGVAHIALSKNGMSREVALSTKARDTLRALQGSSELMFPVSPNALRLSWTKLVRATAIDDLRFHDLRHEAISRFFECGLSIPEVALMSGHKDLRMLYRYTHLRAEDVSKKLG